MAIAMTVDTPQPFRTATTWGAVICLALLTFHLVGPRRNSDPGDLSDGERGAS